MTEPTPQPSFSRRFAHSDRSKIVALAGACLVIVISAAATMGASPLPPTTGAGASPDASSAPAASAKPRDGDSKPGPLDGRLGFPFGALGGLGGLDGFDDAGRAGIGSLGGVEITAINGSSLSLRTVDGWTRTIEVTSSTQITKGGDTITVDDLAVGDTIRFRQQRNDDGTFTITRIAVVLPTVSGTVTATTSSTISVKQRDGTSVTLHVSGSTRFRVEGATGTAALADVATGMRIVASGTKNADGSLDAAQVLAGTGQKLGRDHPWKQGGPDASPAPSGSANPG